MLAGKSILGDVNNHILDLGSRPLKGEFSNNEYTITTISVSLNKRVLATTNVS